jgi:hypothetical protein
VGPGMGRGMGAQSRSGVLDLTDQTFPSLENVMTGAGLNDPDEAIREAERRDLEAERDEEPAQERAPGEESPEPDANDGEEDKKE